MNIKPILLICLFVLTTRSLGSAQEVSTVRLGYFIGGRTTLFGRAFAAGNFDKEGVKVKLITRWLRGELHEVPENLEQLKLLDKKGYYGKMSGPDIINLISSGTFDGGLVGEASFIEAIAEGKKITAVALLGHDKKEAPGHGIVMNKDVLIKKPADFSGLKLLSRRAGPGDAVFLKEFLRQEGVKPGSVTVIEQVDDDKLGEMLHSKKADGGYMHLMALAKLAKDGEVYVYRPLNWVNPEISLALLVFNTDFLKKNKPAVEKIISGYMERILLEKNLPRHHREKSWNKGKTGLMSLEYQEMSLPVYDYPPLVRPELLQEMQTLMLRHGELKTKSDLSGHIDNSFINSVLNRRKK